MHTDAVQAVGKRPVRVDDVPVHLLTLTGHKIYGPKGTGLLFVRSGTSLSPLLHGGGQERGLRPGTEDVGGAVGLARALHLAVEEREAEGARLASLRDELEATLTARVVGLRVNAGAARRAPHVSNVAVPDVDGRAMIMALDLEGIAVSGGSACNSGAQKGSHVIAALYGEADAHATVRFSLGRSTTRADVERAADITDRRDRAPAGARMSRVLVAMSGGVDSSVAAALLVEEGHEVVGVTMKTFCYSETPGHGKTCCGLDGIADARRVAAALGIPHYVFDVEEEFTRDVIDDFVAEYAQGRTPNPCVRCNCNTKFRDLLARGRALGCDAIASGHYVRSTHGPGRLGAAAGPRPRQGPELLPLGPAPGDAPAPALPPGRAHEAGGAGPRAGSRPGHRRQARVPGDLLRPHRGLPRPPPARSWAPCTPPWSPGPIVDRRGQRPRRAPGYAGFTVGQRKGLGGGFPEAMFVLEIRPGDARGRRGHP